MSDNRIAELRDFIGAMAVTFLSLEPKGVVSFRVQGDPLGDFLVAQPSIYHSGREIHGAAHTRKLDASSLTVENGWEVGTNMADQALKLRMAAEGELP